MFLYELCLPITLVKHKLLLHIICLLLTSSTLFFIKLFTLIHYGVSIITSDRDIISKKENSLLEKKIEKKRHLQVDFAWSVLFSQFKFYWMSCSTKHPQTCRHCIRSYVHISQKKTMHVNCAETPYYIVHFIAPKHYFFSHTDTISFYTYFRPFPYPREYCFLA